MTSREYRPQRDAHRAAPHRCSRPPRRSPGRTRCRSSHAGRRPPGPGSRSPRRPRSPGERPVVLAPDHRVGRDPGEAAGAGPIRGQCPARSLSERSSKLSSGAWSMITTLEASWGSARLERWPPCPRGSGRRRLRPPPRAGRAPRRPHWPGPRSSSRRRLLDRRDPAGPPGSPGDPAQQRRGGRPGSSSTCSSWRSRCRPDCPRRDFRPAFAVSRSRSGAARRRGSASSFVFEADDRIEQQQDAEPGEHAEADLEPAAHAGAASACPAVLRPARARPLAQQAPR